jgi:magnesium-transporting ATPase (P-type)
MTALLTGRELETAEMRRSHHRRKGETNGPFSWGSMLDFFVWAVILAALFYVCFLGGRWYESAKKDTVHPASIAKEYKSFRIPGNH